MLAIRFDRFGGPEVLTPVDVPVPVPGPGETLITVEAAGVNFADTFQVDGSYLSPDLLPHVPGGEVVGRTRDGRRVLAKVTHGYAQHVVARESAVVEVPEALDAAAALALLTQGLTAWHLLRSAARLRPGERVVVHSAAGVWARSRSSWPGSSGRAVSWLRRPRRTRSVSRSSLAPTRWCAIRWRRVRM